MINVFDPAFANSLTDHRGIALLKRLDDGRFTPSLEMPLKFG
jgi:hypothetical protein